MAAASGCGKQSTGWLRRHRRRRGRRVVVVVVVGVVVVVVEVVTANSTRALATDAHPSQLLQIFKASASQSLLDLLWI